ncbi:MAG: CPBP family intramembrane metalloprotease [Eubacteriales bacterium]|nr:CPBP family intramembrane metalloprotease [Eubacteriales bacterium]
MKKWMRTYPVAAGFIGFLIGYVFFRLLPEPNQAMAIVKRALPALLMLAVMGVAGGRQVFAWEKGSFARNLILYKSMLVVAVGIGIFTLIAMAIDTKGVPLEGWGARVVLLAVEFFFVGLFEETCFRGVLMGGLVAKWGNTRRGLFGALIVSGLIFGFAHVDRALLGPLTVSTVLQICNKTLTAGAMGLLIGAGYLVTKNIWAVAILHGLNDFILSLGEALYRVEDTPKANVYVNTQQELSATVFLLLFTTALHLWPLIAGLKLTARLPLPQKGAWKDA